jgi:hypothetical protein
LKARVLGRVFGRAYRRTYPYTYPLTPRGLAFAEASFERSTCAASGVSMACGWRVHSSSTPAIVARAAAIRYGWFTVFVVCTVVIRRRPRRGR